jgi:hypothetical protein
VSGSEAGPIVVSWGLQVVEFLVPVRNEFTGEVRVVPVNCAYDKDAQIEALRELFLREGWRKATALEPQMGIAAS